MDAASLLMDDVSDITKPPDVGMLVLRIDELLLLQ